VSAVDSASDALNDSIRRFADRNADYYVRVFGRMHGSESLVWTFNFAAALFGPWWAGARGAWGFFWTAALAEVVALVQIGRGWFLNASSAALQRAEELHAAALARALVAEQALQQGDVSTARTFERIAHNLQTAADQVAAAAQQSASGTSRQLIVGIALLLTIKLAEGLLANWCYERQYSAWRVNASVPSGISVRQLALTTFLILVIYPLTIYRFTTQQVPGVLQRVPVDKSWFTFASRWLDTFFAGIYQLGHGVFDAIRDGIRALVGVLEVLLVLAPWPVVMTVIVVAAWRLAGARLALVTAAAVAYLAVLGLWEPAMQTVALLGTAALICVVTGIPLGIWFSRSERAYSIARPVLDLMQTMPAIVYLIPAIAFFGTGSPPGVIATIIFGMPPVVRLTALGIQQVPAGIKEGARAFGASRWQLLTGVELPLALPSIMAGVNQTILMCLSMVVVAALIGAQGLGSTVLEALQFAATGQGILAGIAILLCAVVIDRLVQKAFGANRDPDN
jgi:glycine betaine/proline transport system permease protein